MKTLQQQLHEAKIDNSPWLMKDCHWQMWFNSLMNESYSIYGAKCEEPLLLLSRILCEEIFTRIDQEDVKFSNFEDYHPGMFDMLRDILIFNCVDALGFAEKSTPIEFRHARKLIKDCWQYPFVGYSLYDYLTTTGMLNSSSNSALEDAVVAVIAANPVAVAEYKAGKTKAIGAIMGVVLKQVKGDPREINALIISKIQ